MPRSRMVDIRAIPSINLQVATPSHPEAEPKRMPSLRIQFGAFLLFPSGKQHADYPNYHIAPVISDNSSFVLPPQLPNYPEHSNLYHFCPK
ncbi:hypothetical protein VNO77_08458 [Canavalia gladiata]|uniref:Uncharacterized protein n=1 Tax=Canavalia gladiata TaxID=3824 RepID=A0AAN9M994_CANGL